MPCLRRNLSKIRLFCDLKMNKKSKPAMIVKGSKTQCRNSPQKCLWRDRTVRRLKSPSGTASMRPIGLTLQRVNNATSSLNYSHAGSTIARSVGISFAEITVPNRTLQVSPTESARTVLRSMSGTMSRCRLSCSTWRSTAWSKADPQGRS